MIVGKYTYTTIATAATTAATRVIVIGIQSFFMVHHPRPVEPGRR